MANQRATASLLLIASLLVAVALSGADARPTEGPNKSPVVAKPECDEEPEPLPSESLEPPPHESPEPPPHESPPCESPEPEPKPELTCNKAHGVQAGETCYSVGLGVGLTLDQFLSFNPNIDCCNLFIGQWVCLEATSTCA